MKNQRGVVYLETLIGFLPAFIFFLATLHIADASVASLVMGHAAEAAARAAVVVLPDDGAYYGDPENGSVHQNRDKRATEVEHAADIVLSANRNLDRGGANVSLDSQDYTPTQASGDRQLLTARVTSSYRCLVALFCPGGMNMKAEAQLIYQGARYQYEPASGWLTSAITRKATGPKRPRPKRPETGENSAHDEGRGHGDDGAESRPPHDTADPPLHESDPIARNDEGGKRNPSGAEGGGAERGRGDSDPGSPLGRDNAGKDEPGDNSPNGRGNGTAAERGNGNAANRGNDDAANRGNGDAANRGNDDAANRGNGDAADRGNGKSDPEHNGPPSDRGQDGSEPKSPRDHGDGTRAPADSATAHNNHPGAKPDDPSAPGAKPNEPIAQHAGTKPNEHDGQGSSSKPPTGVDISKPAQGDGSKSPAHPDDPSKPVEVASNTGPRCSGSTCGIGGSGKGGCFVAGTRVSTPLGDRPIELVAVGDSVHAFDAASHTVVVERVARAYVRKSSALIDLEVRYEADGDVRVISGTPEHPFYVPFAADYVAMSRLTPGTRLQASDGQAAYVIATHTRSGAFTVFNIEVEAAHNYFVAPVGQTGPGLLVHNRDPNCRSTDDSDDDKGGDPTNDRQTPEDAAQSIRDRFAPEWAIDPATGRFDPSRTMDGLTPQEVDDLAHQPPKPGEEHAVERRRRHIEERRAKGQKPQDMEAWANSGFNANVNRATSSLYEGPAVAAVGGRSNNASAADGGQNTWTYREWIDPKTGRPIGGVPAPRPAFDEHGNPQDAGPAPEGAALREVTTRPDGVRPNAEGGLDIIEHKHMTGKETVYNDDPQLRAQREMAANNGGSHELVLSSDKGYDKNGKPIVRPSPGAANGTTVKYYDPETGRVTHVWKNGKWVDI